MEMRRVGFLVALLLGVVSWALADNDARIEQVGDNNTANIKQQGGSQNFAEAFQFGDWNDSDFLGYHWFNTLGFLQFQQGNWNEARLEIRGNGNHIAQWQEGEENIAELFVEGDGNVAKQVQLGNDNESFAEIFGSYNVLYHYQEGNGWSQPLISILGSWQVPVYIIQIQP